MSIVDDLAAAQAKATKKTTPPPTYTSAYPQAMQSVAAQTQAALPTFTPVDVTSKVDAFGNVIGAPANIPNATASVYNSIGTPTPSSSSDFVGPKPVVTPAPTGPDAATRDAFANLQLLFESYGLGSLADTITKLMTAGETPQGALVKLKYDKGFINGVSGARWNDAYTARFAGNQTRIANGLNAISEAQYITNEDAYSQTLKSYGLGNMLSTDRAVNEAKFAQYIGNDISPTEFNDRIKIASDNVINADPNVMATFKQYYGGLTNADLVSYFLAPDETLPMLQQKTAAAQIGTASMEQGLGTDSAARAMQLAQLGVNQPGGVNVTTGYQNIADVLPASQKLSSIYKEAGINYDKTAGENEFLLQNADAAAQRKRLASMERAQFSGDSGINASQGYGLARSIQGKF